MTDEERFAPEGAIFVCKACGKTAKDICGGKDASYGWDVSCSLNALLCDEKSIERDENGRVTKVELYKK